MAAPAVAIVTPTHQRRNSLARVLEALCHQSCSADFFSVVVVCDGCTDGTAEMLHRTRYPFDLRVIEQLPGVGPAAARNRALLAAQAPIILFLDDDVVPTEQLIATHAAHHTSESDVVVIGPLVAPPVRQQPWIRWEAETLGKQYAEMQDGAWDPTPRQFYTGNASVRRDHILAAGGFDPSLRRGEDVELAVRLQRRGLRFIFEPAASGLHFAERSFASWIDAAGEYGRIEAEMGPVWGTRSLVDIKAREFTKRHVFVRRTVKFGLAAPATAPAVVAAGRIAGRALAGVGLWRWARGMYTVLFELAYWRGVDSAAAMKNNSRKSVTDGIGVTNR